MPSPPTCLPLQPSCSKATGKASPKDTGPPAQELGQRPKKRERDCPPSIVMHASVPWLECGGGGDAIGNPVCVPSCLTAVGLILVPFVSKSSRFVMETRLVYSPSAVASVLCSLSVEVLWRRPHESMLLTGGFPVTIFCIFMSVSSL
uniref:Uncharacterized protein n=1 Tax=Ditylenchus dipsaci TaxID=166011 RepID=A0A915DZT5_9BILA